MYTIVVHNDNTMTATVKQRILQRTNLVDCLRFLVEPYYNGLDMSEFVVRLEYTLPVSQKPCSELLVLTEERVEDFLCYKLVFDSKLTSEAGGIEVSLSFTKVEMEEEGDTKGYVRHVSPIKIPIVAVKDWSAFVPEEYLAVVDQMMLKADAKIKQLNDLQELYDKGKADNMMLTEDTLQLTANGEPIGDPIKISPGIMWKEI